MQKIYRIYIYYSIVCVLCMGSNNIIITELIVFLCSVLLRKILSSIVEYLKIN